jgi:hypothetical protein
LFETILRILLFLLGTLIVVETIYSATRTFVLPRSARDPITRIVFLNMRKVFTLFTWRATTYERRDQIMALYAPFALLSLPLVWLTLVTIGYTCLYVALGMEDILKAFALSGSSALTLGFDSPPNLPIKILVFSEATLGLVLVALLISYLPTMYSAFSRREVAVALLEVRAGSPPSAIEMFARYHRLKRLELLNEVWVQWENWFADVEESHTSLAPLTFFRSPQPERSWITAAGAVLDAAALAASTLDIPRDPQADLCIRSGFVALRRIADFFQIPYDHNPKPTDPISILRVEFDEACRQLQEAGVPLKADLDQAWRDYAGWRVNYDTVLLSLAALTMAPYAPWSSDRSLRIQRPSRLQRLRNAKAHIVRPKLPAQQ